MAPAQQVDSFIDEDEQSCPLCVEEFDLSDRNFRPCPCGYQICQFCFNNIKNNMNGLCPACRRPYDDKTIEWKVVTPEEAAQFKANVQKNAKKKAEQRQKEAQRREVETLNRKHLAGLRVIQKNLVYVVGLSPVSREDDLLQTLRGDKYFGQYGKIIKIVVSKAKAGDPQNNQSIGIYVTFARKDDAARCISAVNGSMNGDRQLRAQLGTTKYCSAYLRNETCTNKACMFLHEPGENEDSYSRQDLSSINSVGSQTQRPLAAGTSSSMVKPASQMQQIPAAAAASQPMARQASKESSDGDGSALPSSASWANRDTQHHSRRGSQATSGVAPSPAVSSVAPASADLPEEPQEMMDCDARIEEMSPESSPEPTRPTTPRSSFQPLFLDLIGSIIGGEHIFATRTTFDNEGEALAAARFPPLFDEFGGLKRKLAREQDALARLNLEQDGSGEIQLATEATEEDEPESGSLQLGGEPEDNRDISSNQHPGFHDQRRPSSQMPIQRGNDSFYAQSQNIPGSLAGRTLTPLQQQQLLMLKSGQSQAPGFLDQFPPGIGPTNRSHAALFQQQGPNRQASRYSFANDSMSAATTVKPAANSKLMAQQASMMPQQGSQFYGSSMQGPPPGLKSTGTPVNTMFGQGHGFTGMSGNSAFGSKITGSENTFEAMLMRNPGGISAGGSQIHDGKREYNFSTFLPYPSTSTSAPASGVAASLYGSQPGAFQDFGPKQKKKGKKHRHANTSSSGGSGLVDLADPSILQARMQQHHQQQQTSGAGQGVYSGQVQGAYNQGMMYGGSNFNGGRW